MANVEQGFKFKGNRKAVTAKIRAFFTAHRKANLASGARWASVSGGFTAAGTICALMPVASFLQLVVLDDLFVWAMAAAVALWAIAAFSYFRAKDLKTNPEIVPDVQRLYSQLAGDIHRGTPLETQFDMQDPTASKPYKTGTSPYSGSSKAWYRHKRLSWRGVLADGSLLAVEVTTKAKTKSGGILKREDQLRGRLVLSREAVFRPVNERSKFASPDPKKKDSFYARGVVGKNGPEILFWGLVSEMDAWLPALAVLGNPDASVIIKLALEAAQNEPAPDETAGVGTVVQKA